MDRPCLVWDGDCGFCRRSVQHLRLWLGERVDFEPYQTAHVRFPAIPLPAFREAVHLVEPDGRVSRGAEAFFRVLAHGGKALPLAAYRRLPGFAVLSEWGYRQVAAHRPLASRLLDLLVGDLVGPPQFRLTRFVFLRLLALVYLAAFLSLGSQVHGLVGERGLLPGPGAAARGAPGPRGRGLLAAPHAGVAGRGGHGAVRPLLGGRRGGSVLALLGFAQGPLFAVCWAFYLSLVHLGQDFLSFQWDVLLVETGFIALLLAPWAHLRPRRPSDEPKPPTVVIWLLRLLLFKLMFSSGLTKLTWDDPAWLDLTALTYHYWTQPIPTALAWYASLLPRALQRPLVRPHVRRRAGAAVPDLRPTPTAADRALRVRRSPGADRGHRQLRLLQPARGRAVRAASRRSRVAGGPAVTPSRRGRAGNGRTQPPRWRRLLVTVVATIVALLSIPPLVDAFHTGYWSRHPDHPLLRLTAATSPLMLSNSYGLFRTMTTTRPEIEIEASEDGQNWRAVAFRYKPGDPARAPRFFAPHMPRLDWQMWFAALRAEGLVGDPEATRMWLGAEDVWLQRLLVALLRGEPQVLELLGPAPFGKERPKYVRLVLWQYRFTDRGSDWWVRQRVGVLAGPLALSQ